LLLKAFLNFVFNAAHPNVAFFGGRCRKFPSFLIASDYFEFTGLLFFKFKLLKLPKN
jgi:hypothetical protein